MAQGRNSHSAMINVLPNEVLMEFTFHGVDIDVVESRAEVGLLDDPDNSLLVDLDRLTQTQGRKEQGQTRENDQSFCLLLAPSRRLLNETCIRSIFCRLPPLPFSYFSNRQSKNQKRCR